VLFSAPAHGFERVCSILRLTVREFVLLELSLAVLDQREYPAQIPFLECALEKGLDGTHGEAGEQVQRRPPIPDLDAQDIV
jgi:hypothetical protein